LSRIERIGQLANASLALAQQLDDLKSSFVRQSMKQLDSAFCAMVTGDCHEINVSKKVVTSRPSRI